MHALVDESPYACAYEPMKRWHAEWRRAAGTRTLGALYVPRRVQLLTSAMGSVAAKLLLCFTGASDRGLAGGPLLLFQSEAIESVGLYALESTEGILLL